MGKRRWTAGQGQGDRRPVLSLPLYSRTELLKNLRILNGHPSPYKTVYWSNQEVEHILLNG